MRKVAKITNSNSLPQWDLTPLFESEDDIPPFIESITERIKEFTPKYEGKVAELSSDEFADAIVEFESIVENIHRIHSYADLSEDLDTQGKRDFAKDIKKKTPEAPDFFEKELYKMDADTLNTKIESSETAAGYKNWIEDIILTYTPNDLKGDKILSRQEKGALNNEVYYTLNDQEYIVDGQKLSFAEINSMQFSDDADARKKAFDANCRANNKKLELYTKLANKGAKDIIERAKAMGFSSYMEQTNAYSYLDNEVL
ncbi:MAG: hypothetical protein GY804_10515 [Alphaproteobacteria bacterium]|nr:hypothetical protein [Alphaproteobacteria bacterium]